MGVARRLLVIGGNGFVGTRVVKTALAQGMRVASLSRSGAPADAISPDVEWLTADAVAGGPPVREALAGCDAVISCLGAFGSNAFMHELNGGANAALAEIAAEAGVQRFAFVSASVIQPVAKAMAAAGYEGYYEGKVKAEEAVTRIFGADGILLRCAADLITPKLNVCGLKTPYAPMPFLFAHSLRHVAPSKRLASSHILPCMAPLQTRSHLRHSRCQPECLHSSRNELSRIPRLERGRTAPPLSG